METGGGYSDGMPDDIYGSSGDSAGGWRSGGRAGKYRGRLRDYCAKLTERKAGIQYGRWEYGYHVDKRWSQVAMYD